MQAKHTDGGGRYKISAVNRNNDFRRAYMRGKSFVSPSLVTYVSKRKGTGFRVGITASKKIGNAVKRNRARRVIRAALRELLPLIDTQRNIDLILVARGKTPFVKSTAVKEILEKHLREAGIIR